MDQRCYWCQKVITSYRPREKLCCLNHFDLYYARMITTWTPPDGWILMLDDPRQRYATATLTRESDSAKATLRISSQGCKVITILRAKPYDSNPSLDYYPRVTFNPKRASIGLAQALKRLCKEANPWWADSLDCLKAQERALEKRRLREERMRKLGWIQSKTGDFQAYIDYKRPSATAILMFDGFVDVKCSGLTEEQSAKILRIIRGQV